MTLKLLHVLYDNSVISLPALPTNSIPFKNIGTCRRTLETPESELCAIDEIESHPKPVELFFEDRSEVAQVRKRVVGRINPELEFLKHVCVFLPF